MLDLRTVYQWLPNVTMFGNGAERFTGISTDSRTVRPGDLYIALRGDRLWAFLASHIQELIESRLPSSASATSAR